MAITPWWCGGSISWVP